MISGCVIKPDLNGVNMLMLCLQLVSLDTEQHLFPFYLWFGLHQLHLTNHNTNLAATGGFT